MSALDLDLNTRGLVRFVEHLRGLALGLTSDILQRAVSPNAGLASQDNTPALQKTFLLEWADHLLVSRQVSGRPVDHTPVIRSAPTHLPDPKWEQSLVNSLAQSLSLSPATAFPDLLFPLAGQMAWSDSAFQHAVLIQVYQRFYKTLIFLPDEIVTVHFSPRVFWVLIAMTQKPPRPFHQVVARSLVRRGWLPRRGEAKEEEHATHLEQAAELFQAVALRLALVPNWAGFWDQWLLLDALVKWRPAEGRLDPRLQSALANLPLVKRTISDWVKPARKGGAYPDLAIPSEQSAYPAWFRLDWLYPMSMAWDHKEKY